MSLIFKKRSGKDTLSKVLNKMLNREESYGEMIKEMKLAYAPINKIFEELLTEVVKSLKLSGLIGVNNSAELEFIVSDRKLLAGIEFNQTKGEVRNNLILKRYQNCSTKSIFYFNDLL